MSDKNPKQLRQSRRRLVVLAAAAGLGAAALPFGAWPQGAANWPAKPVKIIVPWPPAGAIDILARGLAERFSRRWGQPVVVENRIGAASIIGAEALAKAAPDAYTLMVTTEATITGNVHLYKKLPYDPVRDIAPVTQLINLPQLLVANAEVAANSLKELVELARKTPLNYASWGSGSQPHLLFESLKAKTGAPITHVPYKGPADVARAIGAGEVQLALASAATWYGLIKAGKAKALAVSRAERLPVMPQVPTLKEAGFADIDPNAWMGLFTTGGSPKEVIARIHREVVSVFEDADFRDRQLLQRGLDPVASTPEQFAAFIQRDLAFKAKLVKLSGAIAE